MLASSVCAETCTRAPVVVDHGDAGRLAFTPCEVESNEVHGASCASSGLSRRKLCVCDDPECAGQPVRQRRDGGHLVAGGQDRRRAAAVAGGAARTGGVGCRCARRRGRRLRAGARRRRPGLDRRARAGAAPRRQGAHRGVQRAGRPRARAQGHDEPRPHRERRAAADPALAGTGSRARRRGRRAARRAGGAATATW